MMTEQILKNAFLFRQPILNRQQELAGYQLSFQSNDALAADDNSPGASAPLCAAYSELGMRSALGNACAFIGIDAGFLHQEAIELLPPDGVVLELLLDGVPDKTTLRRCQDLRARGYSLALTDYRGIDDRSRLLLPMVEVIKIVELDFATSVQREHMLVKVRTDNATRSNVIEVVNLFRASVVDYASDALVIEVTGDKGKVDAMLRALEPFGIKEIAQSGLLAIGRGGKSITERVLRG